jgi:hypothetical protein
MLMSSLSAAAQVVLDAAINVAESPDAEAIVAVSLRAAADHLKKQKGWSLGVRWSADELIGIATELEAG